MFNIQNMRIFFISLLIFIFLIAFMEFGVRLYIKLENSRNTGMSLKGKTYGIMRSDNELGFTHTANSYNMSRSTNNLGFLNVNDVVLPEERNADDVVFIAYGGSTTFSYNLQQDQAWPYLFQEKMCGTKKNSNKQCKFSVFNGGHIMYSIGHAYKRAERDLPIVKPNYLIIYSGINEYANYKFLKKNKDIDIDKIIKNKEYGLINKYNYWHIKHNLVLKKLIHYKLLTPLKKKILFRSLPDSTKHLNKVTNNVNSVNKDSDKLDESFSLMLDNYLGVLKKFFNLAKKYDAKIIFLVQSQGTDTKHNILFTSISEKAKKKASELGAIVIDTREIIEKYDGDNRDLFYNTGVHFSVIGSNLVAKLLLDKLKEKEALSFAP